MEGVKRKLICAGETDQGISAPKSRRQSTDIRHFFNAPTSFTQIDETVVCIEGNPSDEVPSCTGASTRLPDAMGFEVGTEGNSNDEVPSCSGASTRLPDAMRFAVGTEGNPNDEVPSCSGTSTRLSDAMGFDASHNLNMSDKEECSSSASTEGNILPEFQECSSKGVTRDDINDIGCITAGCTSALPPKTIARLLRENVSLPSNTPVHHYLNGGKMVQAYFRKEWLSEYTWLVWSPSQNGAYCKYCVLFAKPPQGRCHGGGTLGKLVQKPFKDFKNAKGKMGVLDKHEKHQYHVDTILTGKEFLLQYEKPNLRLDSIFDACSEQLAASNKLALKSIVECILYCGRQGVSFRGHRDDTTASPEHNRGNFINLVEFRAQTDQVLRTFLNNAPKMQDTLLKLFRMN